MCNLVENNLIRQLISLSLQINGTEHNLVNTVDGAAVCSPVRSAKYRFGRGDAGISRNVICY